MKVQILVIKILKFPLFMPTTSEKLRGHIGLVLSVRLSVRNTLWQLGNSRTAYARTLKFYMWHVHEK